MIFALTLVGFVFTTVAMALGVIATGRRLRGSCGGVANDACACKRAGAPPADCPRGFTRAPN